MCVCVCVFVCICVSVCEYVSASYDHRIVLLLFSTILIEPGCVATITKYGDVDIQVGKEKSQNIGTELDAIQLSIFSHRFMSTAEQMGRCVHGQYNNTCLV